MSSLSSNFISYLDTINEDSPKVIRAKEKLQKMISTLERYKKILANKESKLASTDNEMQIKMLQFDISINKDNIEETERKIAKQEIEIQKIIEKDDLERKRRYEIPDIFLPFKEELVSRWNEFDKKKRDKILSYGIDYYHDPETGKNDYKKMDEYYYMKNLTDEKIELNNEKSAVSMIWNLIERVKKKIGTITDYTGLHITNGNFWKDGGAVINGYVTGEQGSCEVRSILASGPIYRAHIRVLVK